VPELPEVETVRQGLLPLLGSRIVAAEVFHPRAVRHQYGGADEFMSLVNNKEITAAVRRGKFLWLLLAPKQALLVHLGMSGQIRSDIKLDDLANPHLRVRFTLQSSSTDNRNPLQYLDFIDQRTFGYVTIDKLIPTADGKPGGSGTDLPLLPVRVAHIGRDVLDPHLDIEMVSNKIANKRTEIKRVLLDQTVVSGIGNIYADEALWRAEVHPQAQINSLSISKIANVLNQAQQVILDSLTAGGTSFDNLYVNVNGESGAFSRSLAVYGQAGKPCQRCGTEIARISFMNRSSAICPVCQFVS